MVKQDAAGFLSFSAATNTDQICEQPDDYKCLAAKYGYGTPAKSVWYYTQLGLEVVTKQSQM